MGSEHGGVDLLDPEAAPAVSAREPEPARERPAAKRERRRRLFLDPRLQGRLVAGSLGYALFFALFTASALFLPLMLDLCRPDGEAGDGCAAALSFLLLHGQFWPAALVALLLIGLHALRTSHRIAGPLLRFRRVFALLGQGRIPAPCRLRRGDALGAEQVELNAMLLGLGRIAAEARAEADALLAALARCKVEAPRSLEKRLSEIERRARRLAAGMRAEPAEGPAGGRI